MLFHNADSGRSGSKKTLFHVSRILIQHDQLCSKTTCYVVEVKSLWVWALTDTVRTIISLPECLSGHWHSLGVAVLLQQGPGDLLLVGRSDLLLLLEGGSRPLLEQKRLLAEGWYGSQAGWWPLLLLLLLWPLERRGLGRGWSADVCLVLDRWCHANLISE